MTTPWCHTHSESRGDGTLAAARTGLAPNRLPASLTSALTTPAHSGIKPTLLSDQWRGCEWSALFPASQRKGLGQTIKPVSRENDLELHARFTTPHMNVTDLDENKTNVVSDQTTTQNITVAVIKCPSLCWYTQPGLCLGDKNSMAEIRNRHHQNTEAVIQTVVTEHNGWLSVRLTTWWFRSRLHGVMRIKTDVGIRCSYLWPRYILQSDSISQHIIARHLSYQYPSMHVLHIFVPPSFNMTSQWLILHRHVTIMGMC